MDNYKNDEYYINKKIIDLEFIKKHMKDVDIIELKDNEVLLDSMLFRLIQISENAKKISDSYKNQHKGIQWGEIAGLRNHIVHDYGNVVLDTVYDSLVNDVPDLLEQLRE